VKPFAWPDVIGFGLGVLRLSPDAFWCITPRELSFAIAAIRGPVVAPIARTDFEDLMRTFPDR
jgi:uncharacterized phage protein (TIGR02216 family)